MNGGGHLRGSCGVTVVLVLAVIMCNGSDRASKWRAASLWRITKSQRAQSKVDTHRVERTGPVKTRHFPRMNTTQTHSMPYSLLGTHTQLFLMAHGRAPACKIRTLRGTANGLSSSSSSASVSAVPAGQWYKRGTCDSSTVQAEQARRCSWPISAPPVTVPSLPTTLVRTDLTRNA